MNDEAVAPEIAIGGQISGGWLLVVHQRLGDNGRRRAAPRLEKRKKIALAVAPGRRSMREASSACVNKMIGPVPFSPGLISFRGTDAGQLLVGLHRRYANRWSR